MPFDLIWQVFERFGCVGVKMNSQRISAGVILFYTDTRDTGLTEQARRISPLQLSNLVLGRHRCPRGRVVPSHDEGHFHRRQDIADMVGDSMS